MKAQAGIAQVSGSLAQQAPGFSSLSHTPAKDEEMARMAQLKGLEQGLAREVQERTREVQGLRTELRIHELSIQELRTELRVLKSAEPLVSGKPWLPFQHKAVAGPPAAKRSPTNQVAV